MIELQAQSNEAFIDLLDEPASQVEIAITQSVSRGSGLTSYVGYIVKVNHPIKITVERRYREFDSLRETLMMRWPGIYIPGLPPKHSAGSNNLKVVNERIKYLSYFLNCIAKVNYLFMSEQFQLFLNSNSSDLKKMYQKMPKATYESIQQRYLKIFPELKPDLTNRQALINRVDDTLKPFLRELQQNQIVLVNIKKQLYRLAMRKEEYLRRLGDLYSDALPEFEKYIASNCNNPGLLFLEDEKIKLKIADVKFSKAQNYWLIYEAVRLQILECKAAIQSIYRRVEVQRESERIMKKIASNNEELDNIRLKKTSLKNFFNSNTDELNRNLQRENQFLEKEFNSSQILVMYVNELLITRLIADFKAKRQRIWLNAYKKFAVGQAELANLLKQFFQMVKLI